MNQLGIINFEASLTEEGSWGSRDIGTHECSMSLWECDKPGNYEIEWVYERKGASDCDVTHIGIVTEGTRHVVDYDGVSSLPQQAVELLKSFGFTFEEHITE